MPTFNMRARWLLLAGLTVIVGLLVVWLTVRGKQLGPAASAVLQGGTVVLSVYGGIVFTRQGNDQHIKAVARASARRVLVNYETLSHLATAIHSVRSRMRYLDNDKGVLDIEVVDTALGGLEDQVTIHIAAVDAAIQDWRDLAPAEVDEEVSKLKLGRSSQ